jgi:hypothetical protein
MTRLRHIRGVSNDVEYLNSRDATIMGSRNGHAPIYMWCARVGWGGRWGGWGWGGVGSGFRMWARADLHVVGAWRLRGGWGFRVFGFAFGCGRLFLRLGARVGRPGRAQVD